MTKKLLISRLSVFSAMLMAFFFGFPGLVAAEQARINNTGPDSNNRITIEHNASCDVANNNNVDVRNNVSQNATSGDAVVGGGEWGNYNPATWQARGYTYEQWQAAFSSYLAANQPNWSSQWGSMSGGGNTTGGDATSGDASNASNQRTSIGIDNSGACSGLTAGQPGGGSSNPGQSQSGGQVLSSSSKSPTQQSNNVLGATSGSGGAGGSSLSAWVASVSGGGSGGSGSSIHYPSTSGGSGGGSGSSSNHYSIKNTGPDSHNVIRYSSSSNLNINNSNNINSTNNVSQSSSSGSAGVNGNTKGGSATSGKASNDQQSSTHVNVNN